MQSILNELVIFQVNSRIFSVSVSAWNGRESRRGVGGRFHKCDQPDPKLLIRRPLKITLALKSRHSHSPRTKVGRSLKFHDTLDESKV